MGSTHAQNGKLERVGECLYRYTSNGIYYAVVRHSGKLIRKSLETSDRALAKRRLSDFRRDMDRVDHRVGSPTLAALCERYLAICSNQAPKTLRRKRDIVARINKDWPSGSDVLVTKVKASEVATWLASYTFGWASQHLYLECIRAVFELAVADKIILDNPARSARIMRLKRVRPLRLTPTLEEFHSIVANIRSQPFSHEAAESADFVEFMGLAGMGQAETSSLKWGDIDWQNEQVATYRHKTKTRFCFPLYRPLRDFLERKKGNRETIRDQQVFSIKDAKKALSAACRRLGLPAFSQRALRRTFVTNAIQKGVDPKTLSEWQGHQDGGRLIMSTYSHLFAAHSRKMAELI